MIYTHRAGFSHIFLRRHPAAPTVVYTDAESPTAHPPVTHPSKTVPEETLRGAHALVGSISYFFRSLCKYLRSMSAARAALEMLPSARRKSQLR